MTVCIAAICRDDDVPTIITCCDTLVSSILGKASVKMKNRPLACGWAVMVAGEDGDIAGTVELIRQAFYGVSRDKIDEPFALGAVRKAVAARKAEKIEELIQSQYGMSYAVFRAAGAKGEIPPENFRDAMWSVKGCSVAAEFIVWGFTALGGPTIIHAASDGHVYIREDFAVIGSGGYLAQSVLLHRSHHDYRSFPHTMYAVWEAKKYAERETGVGPETMLVAATKDGKRILNDVTGDPWADKVFEEYGPKEITPDTVFPEMPKNAWSKLSDPAKEED